MIKTFLQKFAGNFIKGGLTIGVALAVIDYLANINNMINFYAFASASFFLLQLFQYSYIHKLNPKLTNGFLKHTIVGGIVYVLYVLLMYFMYQKKYSSNSILITCTVVWFIGVLLYYCALRQSKN